MPIFETILLGKLIAAAFGKAAVGAAVKTGVAVAGKAWVAHDVVSAISHVSDAASAVDAASTAADVADTTAAFTSVAGPVGDCGGILPVDITTTLPTDIPTTPDGVIIDCGTGITPDGTATAATFTTDGVDADKTVHGTDPRNNIHGNPPVDGQGNPIDRGIHGGQPGDVHGPHFGS